MSAIQTPALLKAPSFENVAWCLNLCPSVVCFLCALSWLKTSTFKCRIYNYGQTLKRRNGGKKLAGVFVLRVVDHLGNGAGFNHLTIKHNGHTIADIAHHGKFVANE